VVLNWIRVEDDVPVNGREVIVCTKDGFVGLGYVNGVSCAASPNKRGAFVYDWELVGHGWTSNVTHWMEVPKPPEKPGPFECVEPALLYDGVAIWTKGLPLKSLAKKLNWIWRDDELD